MADRPRLAKTITATCPIAASDESASATPPTIEKGAPSAIANVVDVAFRRRKMCGSSLPAMASTDVGVARGPLVGRGHNDRYVIAAVTTLPIRYPMGA
ncbi:hypothetical protein GCM10027033_28780 [Leucobacter ruminantium]